jgi:hypothetical protein
MACSRAYLDSGPGHELSGEKGETEHSVGVMKLGIGNPETSLEAGNPGRGWGQSAFDRELPDQEWGWQLMQWPGTGQRDSLQQGAAMGGAGGAAIGRARPI